MQRTLPDVVAYHARLPFIANPAAMLLSSWNFHISRTCGNCSFTSYRSQGYEAAMPWESYVTVSATGSSLRAYHGSSSTQPASERRLSLMLTLSAHILTILYPGGRLLSVMLERQSTAGRPS